MTSNNVLGIIYSNSFDDSLGSLTARRTMGSVPFGGRYRLIDFAISNLVNCGIGKVGVIASSNFRSLMDHVGSGRSWDLSRKVDGLTLLPPFTAVDDSAQLHNRIDILCRNMDYIARSKQEYVLMMDSNFISNMDFSKLLDFHTAENADITVACVYGKKPALDNYLTLELDGNSVKSASLNGGESGEVIYAVNTVLMKKALLERLVGDAESFKHSSFNEEIIQRNIGKLKICAYKVTDWSCDIDSLQSYYNANMALLEKSTRDSLFNKDRPVLTKVRNDMPVVYGINSKCGNSLVADGCIIEGTVENSILFRGVRVAKGAVVKNSIIMQDAFVGEDSQLNCVIMDKNTVITPNKNISGDKNYPIYVGKEIVI